MQKMRDYLSGRGGASLEVLDLFLFAVELYGTKGIQEQIEIFWKVFFFQVLSMKQDKNKQLPPEKFHTKRLNPQTSHHTKHKQAFAYIEYACACMVSGFLSARLLTR